MAEAVGSGAEKKALSPKYEKATEDLVATVSKMDGSQDETTPQALLRSFPMSMLTLNTVQMLVACEQPVEIEMNSFVQNLRNGQMEAKKQLDIMTAELEELKAKRDAHTPETNLEEYQKWDMEFEKKEIVVKDAEKRMKACAVDPQLLMKIQPSLAGNCTAVVNEVRATLLNAHTNCNHMAHTAKRLVQHCNGLKQDQLEGKEAINVYMELIKDEADKMVVWAKEVSDKASFTTNLVNTVQIMIDNTITKRHSEQDQAKIKKEVREDEERRKNEILQKRIAAKEAAKLEAQAREREVYRARKKMDREIDNREYKRHRASWKRVLTFGIQTNDVSAEQEKVELARKHLEHCMKVENEMRKEAAKQLEEELAMMNEICAVTTDLTKIKNDVNALEQMKKILRNVKEKLGLFQVSWDKLEIFLSHISGEVVAISGAEQAAQKLFLPSGRALSGFEDQINNIGSSAWQTGKFTTTYNAMSNAILFPMCDLLTKTSTTNWGVKSLKERKAWNDYVSKFFKEKNAALEGIFDNMSGEKMNQLENLFKGATKLQKKVGKDQLSIEFKERLEESAIDPKDAPCLKAMRTAARHTKKDMAAVTGDAPADDEEDSSSFDFEI